MTMLGKKFSEQTKRKISRLRKKWWRDHPEMREKMRGAENPRKKSGISVSGKFNPMFGVRKFGAENPNWKGGQLNSFEGGRVRLYQENSSPGQPSQYQFESRAKAEKALGRPLKKNEIVHHVDGNPINNQNSNLLICDRAYHPWLHAQMRKMAVTR